MFIHDALEELLSCGLTDISVANLKKDIDNLHKISPTKGVTGFHSQFTVSLYYHSWGKQIILHLVQLLEQVSRKPGDFQDDCSDGHQPHNKPKNRYPDRLPCASI